MKNDLREIFRKRRFETKIKKEISNWNELTENQREKILECSDFRFLGFRELVFYKERTIVISCSISGKNKIIIESIFNKEGEIL